MLTHLSSFRTLMKETFYHFEGRDSKKQKVFTKLCKFVRFETAKMCWVELAFQKK